MSALSAHVNQRQIHAALATGRSCAPNGLGKKNRMSPSRLARLLFLPATLVVSRPTALLAVGVALTMSCCVDGSLFGSDSCSASDQCGALHCHNGSLWCYDDCGAA